MCIPGENVHYRLVIPTTGEAHPHSQKNKYPSREWVCNSPVMQVRLKNLGYELKISLATSRQETCMSGETHLMPGHSKELITTETYELWTIDCGL